jgi:DNA repair protein RadA/Sms
MARPQSRYVCQACGEAFLRWEGQCRGCGAWNTLVETVVRQPARAAAARVRAADGPAPEALARAGAGAAPRRAVGIAELDRVLGGGLVEGSLVVLGGEPGIGKSTLLLQAAAGVAAAVAATGGHVLYASAEESPGQIRLRAERLGLLGGPAGEGIRVVGGSEIGRIAEHIRAERPAMAVVDSVQTVRVEELEGPAGSVGQVRESAAQLQAVAKGEGIPIVLVGHVTKDGSLAGPKTLEHLVDVVLAMEGDRYAGLRLLRASKNRFGSTEEVGVFEMAGLGLVEVADPARAFLIEHVEPAPGSAVGASLEGSRPLLVEVQALVAPSGYGTPARRASGIDPTRLALLTAVLARRAGIALGDRDVYANLAGGLALADPGLDLPLAVALASSRRDDAVRPGTILIGEVGLLGELRGVPGIDRRLREAARLGFTRAIVPRSSGRGAAGPPAVGLEVVAVATLRDALLAALGDVAGRGGVAEGGASGRPSRGPSAGRPR